MEGGLEWLELDLLEPAALRMIRDVGIPVASLEVLFGRKQYMPSVHRHPSWFRLGCLHL